MSYKKGEKMKGIEKKICIHCGSEFLPKEPHWEYCEKCQDNYEYAPYYPAEKRIIEKR